MGRSFRPLLLLTVLLPLAGCALPPPDPPEAVLAPPGSGAAPRLYRTVAVLPCPAGSEYPGAAGEWLAHRLAEGGGLHVVPPGRAEILLRDRSFSFPPGVPRREAWREAASILGAEALVSGTLLRDTGPWLRFRTVLRVVDGATGETVYEREVRGGYGGFGFSEYPFWVAATDEAGRVLRERFTGEGPPPAAAPGGEGAK